MGIFDTIKGITGNIGTGIDYIKGISGNIGTGIDYLNPWDTKPQDYYGGHYNDPIAKKSNKAVNLPSTFGTGVGTGYVAPPWIPSINLEEVYNQSRNSATSQVNPSFIKKLNDFFAEQTAKRGRTVADYSTNIQNINDQLQQAQEGYATQRERTTTDVEKNLGDITTGETARQTTEGRQFDTARRGAQSQLGESGLTQSGLGKQQLTDMALNRKDIEQAQKRQIEGSVYAQKTTRDRTFADLASSEAWAVKGAEKGKVVAATGRDRDLEDLMFLETKTKDEIEWARQEAIDKVTSANQQNYFRNYLKGLNQGQQEQANRVYGGVF